MDQNIGIKCELFEFKIFAEEKKNLGVKLLKSQSLSFGGKLKKNYLVNT